MVVLWKSLVGWRSCTRRRAIRRGFARTGLVLVGRCHSLQRNDDAQGSHVPADPLQAAKTDRPLMFFVVGIQGGIQFAGVKVFAGELPRETAIESAAEMTLVFLEAILETIPEVIVKITCHFVDWIRREARRCFLAHIF